MIEKLHRSGKVTLEHSAAAKIGSDGWLPPGGYIDCSPWALDNRQALEQYAQRNEKDGTAAEQLERFLAEHPEMLTAAHAKI